MDLLRKTLRGAVRKNPLPAQKRAPPPEQDIGKALVILRGDIRTEVPDPCGKAYDLQFEVLGAPSGCLVVRAKGFDALDASAFVNRFDARVYCAAFAISHIEFCIGDGTVSLTLKRSGGTKRKVGPGEAAVAATPAPGGGIPPPPPVNPKDLLRGLVLDKPPATYTWESLAQTAAGRDARVPGLKQILDLVVGALYNPASAPLDIYLKKAGAARALTVEVTRSPSISAELVGTLQRHHHTQVTVDYERKCIICNIH